MTEWLTVIRHCGTEDTLCHHAGSWIPLDLELSHTTASSSLRSRQQSLVWITACPRKTCQIKFGICRWVHVEMSACLMIPSLSCVCIIFLFFTHLTEADCTRYKVWPEAVFPEEEWGRWGKFRRGRGSPKSSEGVGPSRNWATENRAKGKNLISYSIHL